jgi:hypothetical protein
LRQDGCEIDIENDEGHCGSCEPTDCHEQVANAQSTCSRGNCTISRCTDGFKDCNLDDEDGCEVEIRNDDQNCGGCTGRDDADFRCEPGATCQDGTCIPADGGLVCSSDASTCE